MRNTMSYPKLIKPCVSLPSYAVIPYEDILEVFEYDKTLFLQLLEQLVLKKGYSSLSSYSLGELIDIEDTNYDYTEEYTASTIIKLKFSKEASTQYVKVSFSEGSYGDNSWASAKFVTPTDKVLKVWKTL